MTHFRHFLEWKTVGISWHNSGSPTKGRCFLFCFPQVEADPCSRSQNSQQQWLTITATWAPSHYGCGNVVTARWLVCSSFTSYMIGGIWLIQYNVTFVTTPKLAMANNGLILRVDWALFLNMTYCTYQVEPRNIFVLLVKSLHNGHSCAMKHWSIFRHSSVAFSICWRKFSFKLMRQYLATDAVPY